MVSFISTLSLFILVLANGYLTFPAHDEKNWSTTFSPSSHWLGGESTESPRPLRGVSNNMEKNELLPEHPTQPSPFNSMGFQMPSATERLPEEHAFQKLRVLNNEDHLESSTFTTESSHMDERALYESSTFTTESSSMEERNLHESSTFTTESSPMDERALYESSKFTTESSHMHQPEAGADGETGKNKREEKINQQPIQIESTTLSMPSFPSTSSAAAPQFDLSTKKYSGSLRDNQDDEGDKSVPKVPGTSDDSLATTYPTPQLDQDGLKSLTNVPNDVLNLDKSNSYVVTDIASTVRATTMENKDQDQEKPTPKPSARGAKRENKNENSDN